MVSAFEQIHQLHNVEVLAHLKHLDFAPLLVHLDWLHVGLRHCLYGYLLSRLLVSCELDRAELALTQRLRDLVVVVYVVLTDDLLNVLQPLLLMIHACQIEDS